VDRDPVLQGDHSKIPIAELGHHRPEPVSVILLPLDTQRMLEDGDATLAAKIGALPEHFLLETIREAVHGHPGKIARILTACMRCLTPTLSCERIT
jgi:hypothetical protein